MCSYGRWRFSLFPRLSQTTRKTFNTFPFIKSLTEAHGTRWILTYSHKHRLKSYGVNRKDKNDLRRVRKNDDWFYNLKMSGGLIESNFVLTRLYVFYSILFSWVCLQWSREKNDSLLYPFIRVQTTIIVRRLNWTCPLNTSLSKHEQAVKNAQSQQWFPCTIRPQQAWQKHDEHTSVMKLSKLIIDGILVKRLFNRSILLHC